MAIEPGSRLDAYDIVRLLGSGGMGEVYLATELRLGRKVALKLLPADLTRDATRVRRFEQEARAASALNHPNVSTIYALGETPDGHHYIAMEYVEGETLRARLRRASPNLREALDITIQVASALTAAHAASIVHRDIKPENVMLRPDGFAKVLDFGLAKLTALDGTFGPGDPTRTVVRTDAGTVVGTVAYMSPEQARGQEVDTRTDVWALGCVLYEMVAGRSPFAAESSSDVLAAILQREPVPLVRFDPNVPQEFQRIVTKALRKDRMQRYQTMRDLLLDLQAMREELQIQSHATGNSIIRAARDRQAAFSQEGPRNLPRRRSMLVAAGLLITLGTAVVFWWRGARQNHIAVAPLPGVAIQRNLTRLTFGPGLQTDVTFSPDGRFVAYASDQAGNFDIWVKPVTGGDPVQITRSAADDTHPVWSPDASRVVFRSERDGGGLFVVPALGGVERQVTSFGSVPSWSPDGQEIVFAGGFGEGDGEWTMRLYVVSADGGNPRELLAEFLRKGRWYWISPHPDGRISVLGRHEELGPGLFTLTHDGQPPIITKESPDSPLKMFASGIFVRRRFQWYPSGSAFLLQTPFNLSGVYNLWKVRVDPVTLRWLSAERLTTGAGADVTPVLARDGTRVAFTTESASVRLWAFPLDPGTHRLRAGKPLSEDGAVPSNSALSPDGRFVMYNLSRPGMRERSELWITSVVDNSSQLVTTDGIAGCWSPDSRMIAYSSSSGLAIREVGGKERLISDRTRAIFVATDWTPDGKLLGSLRSQVFGGDAVLALWPTTDPTAEKPERIVLAKPGIDFWQASFSPNRRWLTFVVQRRDALRGAEIVVAPASDPSRWTEVAAHHPWPDKPRWAADGRTLSFISRWPKSYFNLSGVRFDPERGVTVGEPFVLSDFSSPRLMISPHVDRTEMSVSSRHVVLTMESVRGNIWMLDNVDK